MNDSPSFESAHPEAQAIMKDDFYFSTIEETAPFGSDDGSDTYAGFEDWRHSNKNENPEIFLLEQIAEWDYPTFNLYETDLENLKPYLKENEMNIQFMTGIDAAIVSIAFGQLYLEGTIDHDFIELTKVAIRRELIPKLLNQWDDYKERRKEILEKMLLGIEMINK